MLRISLKLWLVMVAGVLITSVTSGHPSSPNDAIRACTIAELHIAPQELSLRLEIGAADQPVFAGLLRAEVDFFRRTFVIEADGQPLFGHVIHAAEGRRTPRDAVTGQPVPVSDKPTEAVQIVEVRYPLNRRPRQLTFLPPRNAAGPIATIGLVTYQGPLPVHDFDFLATRETLRLDWNEPWNSAFRSPRLKRYYRDALSAAVFVDRREVQIEIIARLRSLPGWQEPGPVVDSSRREEIRRRLGEFIREQCRLNIDGQPVTLIVDQVQFMRLSLAKLEVAKPSEDVPVETAMVGVMLVHGLERPPNAVRFGWVNFTGALNEWPAYLNGASPPERLSADSPELIWLTQTRDEPSPAPPPIERRMWSIPVASLACLLGVIGWCAMASGPVRRRIAVAAVLLLLAAFLWPVARWLVPDPFASEPPLSDERAQVIVGELLDRAYHAFDFRSEEAIYDALAQGVSGDLLRQTYLEIRKALEAQAQGARIRVRAVRVLATEAQPIAGGFDVKCRWTVGVALSHWGHTHERTNEYEGELSVRKLQGQWRITAMRILDEKLAQSAK